MKVIFLDIDGVLNDHDYKELIGSSTIQNSKVQLFNSILLSTGAFIVLSSAWRYLIHRAEVNLVGMRYLLKSHGLLGDRLIGYTEMDSNGLLPYQTEASLSNQLKERGMQIENWLKFSPSLITKYVVLDDLDLGITDCHHPFVQTQSAVGLTEVEAAKCVQILLG